MAHAEVSDVETPVAEGEASDWRQAAVAGARDPDRVSKHLEGFEDLSGLAEAYVEARTAISSGKFKDRTVIPGDDAEPAAWAAFWQQMPEDMRPPATPADYAMPETGTDEAFDPAGDERLSRFLGAMHDSGASNRVVQAALGTYVQLANEASQTVAVEETQARETAEAELRGEWGRDYEKQVELANRFLAAGFGAGSDFIGQKLADGTALGSHPVFIRMAARMGRLLGEDEMRAGVGSEAGQSIQDQIDEITEQAHKSGNYYDSRTQSRLRPLYERLHGTVPADGRSEP